MKLPYSDKDGNSKYWFMERYFPGGDIFELGKGENFSINEVADMFNCNKTYIPARPGEYDKTLCDYSRAKLELGWEPEKDLPSYIAKWLEENE